ncbi:MAG: S41 family peptidase [Myxococcota bacterium]
MQPYWIIVVALGLACGRSSFQEIDAGSDADPDTGLAPAEDAAVPEVPAEDPCVRVLGGPIVDAPLSAAIARAHATARYFRLDGRATLADEALIDGLTRFGVEERALTPYAAALSDVCLVESRAETTRTEVRDEGWAFVLRPGDEAAAIPDGVPVVLDLRSLSGAETWADLRASLGGLVDVAPFRHSVRRFSGHVAEFNDAPGRDVYSTDGGFYDPEPIEGDARPLVVITGEALTPLAAELALTLRLQGKAWLVGEDVLTSVAEMHWESVATQGVMVHSHQLIDRNTLERIPDRIPADVRTRQPLRAAERLLESGAPPPIVTVTLPNTRASFEHIEPTLDVHTADVSRERLQAGLLIAHGALKRFFPYFDVVPDNLDDALTRSLSELEELDLGDREASARLFRRFLSALDDGHGFVFDRGVEAPEAKFLPIGMRFVGDQLLVVGSDDERIVPGDEVLSIGGERTADLYARFSQEVSAASHGYRRDLAVRRMARASGPTEVEVHVPGDEARRVVLEPTSQEAWLAVSLPLNGRVSGPLEDLGASDIYYLNLDGSWMDADERNRDVHGHLDRARDAAGLVVDMRGYPGGLLRNFNTLQRAIGRITARETQSAFFDTPRWRGPSELDFETSTQTWPRASNAVGIPVVWLVGPGTVSAAENLSQIVVGADAVTVIGELSAATNGNITGVEVPGRFVVTFTGMRVRNPDGSQFHGIGIVPDRVVKPTAESLRDGRDLVLDEAISFFTE